MSSGGLRFFIKRLAHLGQVHMADPYLCFIVVTWKTISTLPNRSLPFDITQKRQEEWNKVLNWALGYALRGDRYPLLLALKSSRSRCKIPLLSQPLRLNFAPLCPQLAAHILIASGRPAECVKMKPRKGRRRKGNESPPSFRVLATPTTLTRLRNFGDRSGEYWLCK